MERARKAYFSGSWYPGNEVEVEKQLKKWDSKLPSIKRNIISGIVPHAGWFFSGLMAYDVIRRFPDNLDALILLGGHLPKDSPILYCDYDYCDTPGGRLPVKKSFISVIKNNLPSEPDGRPDNTIEVQLPIIRQILGELPIIPLRVPAGKNALNIIEIIDSHSLESGLKIAMLGSTDLTHYGPNYGFMPAQSLGDPLKWVEDSDRKIIQAMVDIEPMEILKQANRNQSACSAGAAACAAAFAGINGVEAGILLNYETSYSKHKAESFVGYGSIIYVA